MDGIGGTLNNTVPKKWSLVNSVLIALEAFAMAADKLCKIDSLYLPLEDYMEEPSGIEDALEIKGILKIHHIIRESNHQGCVT